MTGYRLLFVIALMHVLFTPKVYAHGGVAFEEDRCVINIDFLRAHFTIYQPTKSRSEEFCEDIPGVTDTIFVMEYLHSFLSEMPVDFRIIRDEQDFGIYARWEDVQSIDDIDSVTAFYQSPQIRPSGELTVNYSFEEKGRYIGIVTAQHPSEDTLYKAVFYFQVGGPDYGSIPLFLSLALILQVTYWFGSGGFSRWRERRDLARSLAENNDN
ncbi:MAG: hypothetical protein R3332_07365 [Pseudohongiellaceae bacterium]|nr:hypothetical protein [Pseudohongiellaceae bacterium]